MTVTFGDLVLAERALKTLNTFVFPVRTAYVLHQLTTRIAAETRFFHVEEERWIRELGERQPDGSVSIVAPEKRAEFLTRLQELSSLVIDDRVWPRALTLADLEAAEDPATHTAAKFAPADLVALGPFLADEGLVLNSPPAASNTGGAHGDTGAAASGLAALARHGAGDGLADSA